MPRTDCDRRYQYFPAFLDLVGKHVVVIGGGAVAVSKVAAVLPCGVARLTVVAPSVDQAIADHAILGRVTWLRRPYSYGDLAEAQLAFAATDDRLLNARVAGEARERGVPVLAVDDVANCDFITPALVRRGDLTIAISTHGRSPALARRVRERLDAILPAHWGDLLAVASEVRERLGSDRRSIAADAWQDGLNGEVEDLTRAGQTSAAVDLLLNLLRHL